MIIDATTGTIIVSSVVVLATALGNGIGAAINSRRYDRLELNLEKRLGPIDTRLTLLEHRHADCPWYRRAQQKERDE